LDKRSSISTAWISNLPKEERDSFISFLMSNYDNPSLIRLKELVVAKRLSLEASERSSSVYDNANWAYLQAHNNGANQALKFVEDLLAFVK
jgi:hypothetical protein